MQPCVSGPYATCTDGVWRSHPSLAAASQYVARAASIDSLVWYLDDGEWSIVRPMRRPYGARSGESSLPRIEVRVPEQLLAAVDSVRGAQTRSSFVRLALKNAVHLFSMKKGNT